MKRRIAATLMLAMLAGSPAVVAQNPAADCRNGRAGAAPSQAPARAPAEANPR